jgi:hypothetical protein
MVRPLTSQVRTITLVLLAGGQKFPQKLRHFDYGKVMPE